ncbi:MAG: tRNA (adenosine(37)-N6)-dimethylallyltransferase MiaA [Bdellovibrionales bacterium]|nr:tRNA (adenosine(37)-N6)-dimethylallyltransferase MiaA [Bdellovibrionales bacterium]
MAEQSVLVLTGPTAAGKSALAMALAARFGAHIVNADSVQVYRHFDIGSGKPTLDDFAQVPHHLYSFVDPDAPFDAELFRQAAVLKLNELEQSATLPLLVGGSGLYIRSLLCGLVRVEGNLESARREVLDREALLVAQGLDGGEGLHQWLTSLDPRTAAGLHPADVHRVRRALEVALGTGQSLSVLQADHGHQGRYYRALVLAVLPERRRLYEAINRRVEQMFADGLIEEVRELARRFAVTTRPFGAIGYRHVLQMLDGRLSYSETVETLKRDTRRFAKRQMTWWRNQPQRLGWELVEPLSLHAYVTEEGTINPQLERVIARFLTEDMSFGAKGIAFLALTTKDVAQVVV